MSETRTFEQIKEKIERAIAASDASVLETCAEELISFDSPEAGAWMRLAKGVTHQLRGGYPAALEHLRRAHSIFEELGDRQEQASATVGIGTVHRKSGNYPAALEHFQQALSIYEEGSDPLRSANNLSNIGVIHFATGNYPVALDHFQQAQTMFEELGDKAGVARATSNIGLVHQNSQNYSAALEQFRQVGSLLEELGHTHGFAMVKSNILDTLVKQGNFEEARRAMTVTDEMGIDDPAIGIRCEISRARIQANDGDLRSSQATLEAALKTPREHDLLPQEADVHKQMRDVAEKQRDLPSYIAHNDAFHKINEEIRGAEQQRLLAIQEKEREIEAINRAHEKERTILYSTLPKDVADRMVAGEQISDHFDGAAVLFMDIVGFTSLSSRVPARQLIHLLEAIFSVCDEVCERYGVTKVKTIGDSYMAVGGVPDASEDHSRRTASAACDMLAALETLVVEVPEELGDKSWVKDIGEIQVRMESTGEPGRIQVSEAFAGALGGSEEWHLEPRTIEVKGKGEMRTYWLERG